MPSQKATMFSNCVKPTDDFTPRALCDTNGDTCSRNILHLSPEEGFYPPLYVPELASHTLPIQVVITVLVRGNDSFMSLLASLGLCVGIRPPIRRTSRSRSISSYLWVGCITVPGVMNFGSRVVVGQKHSIPGTISLKSPIQGSLSLGRI